MGDLWMVLGSATTDLFTGNPGTLLLAYGPLGVFVVLFLSGYLHSPLDKVTKSVEKERDEYKKALADLNDSTRRDILTPVIEMNRWMSVIVDRLTSSPPQKGN